MSTNIKACKDICFFPPTQNKCFLAGRLLEGASSGYLNSIFMLRTRFATAMGHVPNVDSDSVNLIFPVDLQVKGMYINTSQVSDVPTRFLDCLD